MSKAIERLKAIQDRIAKATELKSIAEFQQAELESMLAEQGFGSIEELESELHDLERIIEEEEASLDRRIKALNDEIEKRLY